MGDHWSEDRQVHISAVKTSSFWKVANGGADADLVMQIVNHLVGDGVVKNAACWPDDKMILKARVGHHSRKAVNAGPTFKSGEIQCIFERHHPGLLLHLRIDDGGASRGLGEPHAGGMTGRCTKDEEGECQ